jgi:hypothetical protein
VVEHGAVVVERAVVVEHRAVAVDGDTARLHGLSRANQEFHAPNRWLPSVHPRGVSVVVHPCVHCASLTVHGTTPQSGIAGPAARRYGTRPSPRPSNVFPRVMMRV